MHALSLSISKHDCPPCPWIVDQVFMADACWQTGRESNVHMIDDSKNVKRASTICHGASFNASAYDNFICLIGWVKIRHSAFFWALLQYTIASDTMNYDAITWIFLSSHERERWSAESTQALSDRQKVEIYGETPGSIRWFLKFWCDQRHCGLEDTKIREEKGCSPVWWQWNIVSRWVL